MAFRASFLTNARLPERIRRRLDIPAMTEHGGTRPFQIRSSDFHRYARELTLRA